jgi:hypothetical protein
MNDSAARTKCGCLAYQAYAFHVLHLHKILFAAKPRNPE